MIGAAAPSPGFKPRHWIACADDFAIEASVVDATLELIERGRITATSALVDSPLWPQAAQRLQAQLAPKQSGQVSARADVGLHLNLTQPLATRTERVWPLAELIARCALGALPRGLLRGAIEHQLDAFENAMGRRPDYIDGHQHVHQFAVVRDTLLNVLLQRYEKNLPWLRSTRAPRAVRDLKARGIAALGDRSLRKLAVAAKIHTNAYLVGVYDFDADSAAYWQHLRRWLRDGPEASVLMTHPALRAPHGDPLAAARPMEFAVLASAQFGALLTQSRITLTTGTRLFATGSNGSAADSRAQDDL